MDENKSTTFRGDFVRKYCRHLDFPTNEVTELSWEESRSKVLFFVVKYYLRILSMEN
jgi:hypothetical protein